MLTYEPAAPNEIHPLGDRRIMVVRADLVPHLPLPPYLKMIELLRFVKHLKQTTNPKVIGYYAQDASEWTRIIPTVCREFGIKGLVGFAKKKVIPWFIQELNDGEVFWIKPNMYAVNWSIMRKHVESMGGFMLPMGVDHPFVVASIKEFFDGCPLPAAKTFIVPVGSGVALSGILQHLQGRSGIRIIGVTSRPVPSVQKIVNKYWHGDNLTLVEGSEKDAVSPPFPAHRFWECQTWGWLSKNLQQLQGKLCYLNLGS